ncbi:MAG: hypothetical protein PHW32_04670 [Bacilli bacterium]|nr:hypothetical protein [Bacilli bacterium]
MIIEYLVNMSNSEKIYLSIVIVLIIALILFFFKTRSHSKLRAIPKVEPIKKIEISKPITDTKEPVVSKEEINKTEPTPQTSKMELDNVLDQMRNNLIEQQEVSVKTFEDEQEEKSIISYQELLSVNEEGPKIEKDEINKEKSYIDTKLNRSFRNSEFISPIYGRVDNDADYPTIPKFRRAKLGIDEEYKEPIIKKESKVEHIDEMDDMIIDIKEEKPISIPDLEETINIKNLKEEMIKNEKFLKTLRDFRKNLE